MRLSRRWRMAFTIAWAIGWAQLCVFLGSLDPNTGLGFLGLVATPFFFVGAVPRLLGDVPRREPPLALPEARAIEARAQAPGAR